MVTHTGNCKRVILAALFYKLFFISSLLAADQPQWAQRFSRNMISSEVGLADDFDPATGKNIKWIASLGSETWATPVIASGRVFIGTNNSPPRDPRHRGDRGILLCLDEKDGSLLWQLVVPKLGPDPYLDWPRGGIVSPTTVEQDRVYVVTNRGEALCLDLNGQTNGNDGPFLDEARHMTPDDAEPLEVTNIDADIIWLFDIPKQAGTYPHDAAHCSILLDGDFLYLNTSNGVDNTHRKIRNPDGPSLIVLHKKTGRLLARDYEGIGHRIFHSTWSSPALGVVNGRKLIFFGGPDGVVYAFDALDSCPPPDQVKKLNLVWKFDCDPTAPKKNIHKYLKNRTESPSNIMSMPVFYKNRIYVTVGGDIWWGKRKAWLKCIDATKTGDITTSGLIFSYDLSKHCSSTPAIYQDMVFISDCGGLIHCLNAETGRMHWTHQADSDMWSSTLAADGKIYVGTRRRDFWILAAQKQKKVIRSLKLDSPLAATPVAANGVLYITTMRKLYAVQQNKVIE